MPLGVVVDWGSVNGEQEGLPAGEVDLRDGHVAGSNLATESGRRFRARLIAYLRACGYPALDSSPDVAGPALGAGCDPANPLHLQEAGRALARYHQRVRSFPHRFRAGGRPPLPSLERSGPHTLACFTSAAEAVLGRAERARLTRANSILWSQFIRVPENLTAVIPLLGQLVIHGSYGPDTLIYAGDRIAGVAGYHRAAYDLRALDLGNALVAFAGPGSGVPAGVAFDLGRCGTLVAGYREVEALPDHELAAMPLILRVRSLTGVLAGTTSYLSRHAGTIPSGEEARRLLDAVEREADQVRWLETGDEELVAALGGSLVA